MSKKIEKYPLCYAVKHKDVEVRMSSRSGGFFTALSNYVLKQNGIIYGCVLDEEFKAIHIRTTNESERDLMRGSKYIQSDLQQIFSQVKEDLDSNKKVLFSGTSCQISGLKSFLRKRYDNLICVDIVCHGVPSPLVFEKYIKWQEEKNKSKCIKFDFRNKKDFGWNSHVETLYFENKKVNSEIFKTIFYSHCILRPACYKCPYKSTIHPGDLTLADHWGIDKIYPDFNDNKGVSLVLINSEIGEELFDIVTDDLDIKKCNIDDCMSQSLISPFPEPKNRKEFWNYFYNNPFKKTAKKYGKKAGLIKKIIKKLSNINK